MPLVDLAHDLRWVWCRERRAVLAELAGPDWERLAPHPARLVERLGALAAVPVDPPPTWYARHHPEASDLRVAYFSMEYGIHEALKLYSGGLGVLSGEHLKSASDLGLPLTAVGLAYHHGYFKQAVDANGRQHSGPDSNHFADLPVRPARQRDGTPLDPLEISIDGHPVKLRVWEARLGTIALYLLDTEFAQNKLAWARHITHELYGGDATTRLRQEMVLGIGGMRALDALGIRPTVIHLNEGHAAFSLAELLFRFLETEQSFESALARVRAMAVFTTHTPVPAGFDIFGHAALTAALGPLVARLGAAHRKAFLELGADPTQPESFNMAYFALRTSGLVNGVSRLHGEVSRRMWRGLWPSLDPDDVPISHVTNGIHTASWVGPEMEGLWRTTVSPRAVAAPLEALWERVAHTPGPLLWAARCAQRRRLVEVVRRALAARAARLGHSSEDTARALDPDALTIGFARRFATYKRATLLFRHPDRLLALCTDPRRPVQIVFAGKAHPKDTAGQAMITEVARVAADAKFRDRLVFLEGYDLALARALVQGVDVWLNTPLRPNEASGTSGMKVVPNGGLNLSVLDGWWAEAYDGTNGFAIQPETGAEAGDVPDGADAAALFDLLEREVVPSFYDRDHDGVPVRWLERVKRSVETLTSRFSTDRMLTDYLEKLYLPAHRALPGTGASSR
jgi:starch phosphorylase